VLGGIRIGSHVVIGAGAVVTTIPKLSIAVGNPARVVRTFTNAER
jgi:maltose O-acetyltransferase